MKNVKLLFMDVDGTLTDGKIYMGESGELFKAFNIKDGYAIKNILQEHNIVPVIITARNSAIVRNRCQELDIQHVYQGCKNKKEKILDIVAEFNIEVDHNGVLKQTAFIGDDIVDLECIEMVEYSGCPQDATSEVKDKVNFISDLNGGEGAVREFIEWLLL